MSDDELGNVVIFPVGPGERARNDREVELDELTVRTKMEESYCAHRRSSVSRQGRVVSCRDCGAILDPLTVLAEIAEQREREVLAVRRLRDERERLVTELESLKRQERNAKSRIRAAFRRRPDQAALAEAVSVLRERQRDTALHALDPEERYRRVLLDAIVAYGEACARPAADTA